MTEKADDRIEERLAAMTHWEGERTALWRAALDDTQRADKYLPPRAMNKAAGEVVPLAALDPVGTPEGKFLQWVDRLFSR